MSKINKKYKRKKLTEINLTINIQSFGKPFNPITLIALAS